MLTPGIISDVNGDGRCGAVGDFELIVRYAGVIDVNPIQFMGVSINIVGLRSKAENDRTNQSDAVQTRDRVTVCTDSAALEGEVTVRDVHLGSVGNRTTAKVGIVLIIPNTRHDSSVVGAGQFFTRLECDLDGVAGCVRRNTRFGFGGHSRHRNVQHDGNTQKKSNQLNQSFFHIVLLVIRCG